MSRLKLIFIWLLCVIVSPILIIALFIQAAFGSTSRALSMAIAIDECGNSLFGGSPEETISRRTGLALIAGKSWAVPASKFIDFIFGKGHCLAEAEGPAPTGQ